MNKMSRILIRLSVLCALLLFASPGFARNPLSPTYSAILVESEFRGLEGVDGEELTGTWYIQFLSGNTFRMLKDGEIMMDGTWALSDDQLTLSRLSGPLACAEKEAQGATYTASIRGFSISFKKLADVCPKRAAVMTRGEFRAVAN